MQFPSRHLPCLTVITNFSPMCVSVPVMKGQDQLEKQSNENKRHSPTRTVGKDRPCKLPALRLAGMEKGTTLRPRVPESRELSPWVYSLIIKVKPAHVRE